MKNYDVMQAEKILRQVRFFDMYNWEFFLNKVYDNLDSWMARSEKNRYNIRDF